MSAEHRDAQLVELTMFLRDHAPGRPWQDTAARLLVNYTITKKEKS